MKINRAHCTSIDIRLTDSVPTGAGSISDRGGMRVTIEAGGHTGIGETAPIPGREGPKLEALATEISKWCDSASDHTIEEALDGLDQLDVSRLTRFALHTALIDIQARSKDRSVSQWLREGAATRVRVNGLVSEASPAAVHSRARQLVDQGMTAIKLKVGAVDTSLDITRIVAASEAAGPETDLRLDANGSWSAETTDRIIGRVGKHRISYIEDPTPDSSEFAALAEEIGVDVAVDLDSEGDPRAAIEAAGVKIVVLKPAALGGVDRVIDLARSFPDHRFVISSSIHREIGLAAAVHSAAALPPTTAGPHGLATGRLVQDMDPTLLDVNGEVRVPAGPGIWNESTVDEFDV